MSEITSQWSDWQKGISPTEETSGRGAQNPRLLLAFAALDRARYRAEQEQRQQTESSARLAQMQHQHRHG